MNNRLLKRWLVFASQREEQIFLALTLVSLCAGRHGSVIRRNCDEGKTEETLLSLLDAIEFPHVHTDHALHIALERMSSAHIDILPVVNRADVHKLEGIVTLRDVLDSYGVDSAGSA
jgi:mRNA-degrading endonuclease YafQ of YafQ-DinJ toxin-antitoxin module